MPSGVSIWLLVSDMIEVFEPTGIAGHLRSLLMPWGFALLLPIPVLMAGHEGSASDLGTLYLGLGSACLCAEAFRSLPASRNIQHWRSRSAALLIALGLNAFVFCSLGMAIGVNSNIPFPLLALFGTVPAFGLVPWLTVRTKQPFAAVILGALVVVSIKLAACVVARVVYGPDFISKGYVAADWRSAKLMISTLWLGTLIASGLGALACRRYLFLKSEEKHRTQAETPPSCEG